MCFSDGWGGLGENTLFYLFCDFFFIEMSIDYTFFSLFYKLETKWIILLSIKEKKGVIN